jgi:hypothetical protein
VQLLLKEGKDINLTAFLQLCEIKRGKLIVAQETRKLK